MDLRRPPVPPLEAPAAAEARTGGDEPFPAQVSAGDRRAFAEAVFDQHAEEIYRYLLAWTSDRAAAHELTALVLRSAVAQMERLGEPGTDLEARLIALARAAVARRAEAEAERGGAARDAAAFTPSEPVPLLLEAVARLDDARREVLILRQLLGHPVKHAARLLAFDVPLVEELERGACATLWRRINHAQETRAVSAWDALTVAAALRQGAPSWFAPPGEAALAALREQLLDEADPQRAAPAAPPPASAEEAAGERRRLLPTALAFAARRRWLLAGCVASAAIGTALALTMGGQASQSSSCARGATCLVTTTAAGVSDTVQTFPSAAPPSGLPTSTTRVGAARGFPALTGGTATTGLASTTTTTMRGTTTAPSSTRPRRTTTTTMRPTTTSPPTTQPPTTEPPTSTGPVVVGL